jgi:hypothetical protein
LPPPPPLQRFSSFVSYFQLLFLLKLSQSNPLEDIHNKKDKKCSLYIFKIESINVYDNKLILVT